MSLPEDRKYLGLVTISCTGKHNGFHSCYAFLHLTLQEFLTAIYISSLDMTDQVRIIEEQSNQTMLVVWTFYCGLVDFSNGMERLRKLFNSRSYKTADFMQFAFESQQPVVCDEVVMRENGKFHFLLPSLMVSDLSAIGYVISCTSQPITELDFYSCTFGDDIITALLQLLQFHQRKLHQLEVLTIPYVNNSADVRAAASVITTCTSLRKVSLNFNVIDADIMKCLASELKSFSHLQELTLYFFRNTSSGITLLLNGLQNLLNTKFKLQFSRLNMSDVVGLGRGLQLLTIRVHFLQLSQGSIGVEGAPALAYGLPNLTNLFHLDLTQSI